MADWLKVEKQTPDKPEIAILARMLGISQSEAFLSWFKVYRWADGITENGLVPLLSLDEGDRLCACYPGTFAALASKDIGWMSIRRIKGVSCLVFSNWERHNGKSAKKRALDTEKKRRQRGNSCPDDNGTKTGLEKRRGEYKKENTKRKNQQAFQKPTVEEVRAYCEERNNGIDAEAFVAFYESKDWWIGKNRMTSWKHAVITWEKQRQPARVAQPLTDEELESHYPGKVYE